jgi:hypothetical protein
MEGRKLKEIQACRVEIQSKSGREGTRRKVGEV